ncbi:GNAT family N-acetyltransferase [Anabaena sp. UHCC 0451]|uniref:GNAT family N-acetyltransferase n=1 Tax=Anabaena sp. UHCC 0451 TaxID=2055235 RepID=UPI002B1FD161|nr:GNAT family N-acetyltransferase [Anabaena sp. UHCC 0451]MEA5575316.1 GNAT family N-acetyltransferase [Anabaena sp. UHCC 0451]
MQLQIQLNRGTENSPVNANLVELSQKHIHDYENLWREELRVFQAEDKFWDWLFKLGYISKQDNQEGYALECEGCTQGLMMVETQLHGSRSAIGQRLVYIQYITSAPWNRKEIQSPPRYKGVGTALLRYARLRSVELGYGGRIGLHSLPTAERFYENQNMFNLGIDEEYENLTYFEYGMLRLQK